MYLIICHMKVNAMYLYPLLETQRRVPLLEEMCDDHCSVRVHATISIEQR